MVDLDHAGCVQSCLWGFDSREPVARVIPGVVRNSVRVLVPDAIAYGLSWQQM